MSLRPDDESIRAEARKVWRQRGCPLGRDLDNWLEAERRVTAIRRAAYFKWLDGNKTNGAALDHWLLAEAQHRLAAIDVMVRQWAAVFEPTLTTRRLGTAVLKVYSDDGALG